MLTTAKRAAHAGKLGSIEAPPPGYYLGVPDATYRSWDAVSQTFIKEVLETTPVNALWELEHPTPATRYMNIGKSIDAHLLEPAAIPSVMFWQPCSEKFKGGEKEGQSCDKSATVNRGGKWYCGIHDPKKKENPPSDFDGFILNENDTEIATGILLAAAKDQLVSDLRADPGPTQLSMVWRDEDTGVLCKGRIDKLYQAMQAVNDIKCTKRSDPESWSREIRDRKYYLQGSFYVDGAISVGLDVKDFAWLVFGEAEPYEKNIGYYVARQQDLQLGRAAYKSALVTVAECLRTDEWPGLAKKWMTIEMAKVW